MSYWAEIDENNIVVRVTVGNTDNPDEGYSWLLNNLGGRWIKTSDNGDIRGHFAGIGYYYNEEKDFFICPKPFDSWVLNEETYNWQAPISYPSIGQHIWDEEQKNWVRYSSIPEEYRTEGYIL